MNIVVVSKCQLFSQSLLFSVSSFSLWSIPCFSDKHIYNSRSRHEVDMGQASHVIIHLHNSRQLQELRLGEHCGQFERCMFDLVAQLGLLWHWGTHSSHRVQFRTSQHQLVTSSVGHVYQQRLHIWAIYTQAISLRLLYTSMHFFVKCTTSSSPTADRSW